MTEPAHTDVVEQVQKKIKALSTRDLQLWSIGLLVMLVLAVGFVALVLPNVMWGSRALNVAGTYLPQLFFGFIALIILFNIYVIGQRRELNAARQDLVTELMFSQRAHNLSLIDPLTQIFNRRYLDHIIPKEVTRANRSGASLTFLLLDLDGFRAINARHGHKAGDHLLVEAARLLQRTFSAAETVLRYGGDEFLVLLPECTESQARESVEQLLAAAKLWNETSSKPYKMAFSCGLAGYAHGSDIKDVLHSAEERVQDSRIDAENARRRPQCLVLCDDAEAMQTLAPLLETLEIDVQRCTAARAGLEMLASRRFEALLADAASDEGAALLAGVRDLPSRKHMILIALAAHASDVAHCGANFVIDTPVSAAAAGRSLRVAQGLMSAERQRYYRHSVSIPVTVHLGRGQEHYASATNLSDGGMAIRCEQPVPAGRCGLLRFLLDHDALEMRVEVAWSDSEGHAGLRFAEMSRATRAKLDSWLAERFRDKRPVPHAAKAATA